jgi:hypothetical protein
MLDSKMPLSRDYEMELLNLRDCKRFPFPALHTFCAVSLLLSIDTATSAVLRPAFSDEVANDQLHQLVEGWSAAQDELFSAHLQLRMVRIGGIMLRKLTRDEVNAAMASVDLGERPDDLKKLYELIATEQNYYDRPWAECELIVDGTKVREIRDSPAARDGSTRKADSVFDGNRQMDLRTFGEERQATISPGQSGNRLLQLRDLRFIPTFSAVQLEHSTIEAIGNGRLLIRDTRREIEVDEQTGFVFHCLIQSNGSPSFEVFQQDPVNVASQIFFPTVAIRATYEKGSLRRFTCYVIGEIAVNTPIASDRFRLSAPADTVMVDRTVDPSHPTARRVKSPVKDVAQFDEAISTSSQSWSLRSWLLIGNVIVIILLFVVWCWHKRRSASHHD